MMYEPVDIASSQKTIITTSTLPPPPSYSSDEIFTNYLTAFSDLCNYETTVMEEVHRIFTLINANRETQNCSLFSNLVENLKNVLETLNEYRKFIMQYKVIYEKACLKFETKASIPLMNRYNYIKISGYVNTTEFFCLSIVEVSKLITYAKSKEIQFTTKLCLDCRLTPFYDPSLCFFDYRELTNVDLSDEHTTYLEAFVPYMTLVSTELPTIFRDLSKCPSRRSPYNCTTILTDTLESIEVYINFLRSYKSDYDLLVEFFNSLSDKTQMDAFIGVQVEGQGGRSAYLNIEASYLQTIYDKYTEILFKML